MSRWFTEHRQAWIAEMLEIYGFIQREHLRKKFRISVPQASADLQRFVRTHPKCVRYDLSRKCYVRVTAFSRRTRVTAVE